MTCFLEDNGWDYTVHWRVKKADNKEMRDVGTL